jgi:integrase
MKSPRLKLVKSTEMRPVAARGRQPNAMYRVREHLTEDEMARLLVALKRNRHGQRDWLMGLLIYRHGLRVSEACDLRWDDIDLPKRTIIVRRLKGSTNSTHYLERDEHKAFGDLRRAYAAKGIKSDYVFVNERGEPFGRMGIARSNAGWRSATQVCQRIGASNSVSVSMSATSSSRRVIASAMASTSLRGWKYRAAGRYLHLRRRLPAGSR